MSLKLFLVFVCFARIFQRASPDNGYGMDGRTSIYLIKRIMEHKIRMDSPIWKPQILINCWKQKKLILPP